MLNILMLTLTLATPKVGELAPDFTATDADGRVQALSTLVKQGPVILAFFPKAFTPGCTKELKAYGTQDAALKTAKAQLLAISADDRDKMAEFRTSLNATFSFIPDPDAKLITLYDVKVPVLTLASRTTFVIDGNRRIVSITTGNEAIDPKEALQAAQQACGR